MKITVTLDIEVDPQSWVDMIGTEDGTKAGVRKDVKAYVLNAVQQLSAIEETAAEVSVR
jgi:hypothetical protein